MQNAMFSALFGALTNEHRMNSIANNLANVNTTGYKRDVASFKDTFSMYAHDHIMEPVASVRSEKLFPDPQHIARSRFAQAQTDFAQSSLKITGAPLDVAISGPGFFRIETPQGIFYTRNGHFRLTADGMVITEQGFPVLGEGGPVIVPPGLTNINIGEDGMVYGDGDAIGQIGTVDIDNLNGLEKLGTNLYRARPGADVNEAPGTGFLAQGFLETTNVDPVYEMVNMIEAQRQFEAYTKIMQTSDALDREATTKVGRGR